MCGRYVSGNMSWAECYDWLEGIEAPPPFAATWARHAETSLQRCKRRYIRQRT